MTENNVTFIINYAENSVDKAAVTSFIECENHFFVKKTKHAKHSVFVLHVQM